MQTVAVNDVLWQVTGRICYNFKAHVFPSDCIEVLVINSSFSLSQGKGFSNRWKVEGCRTFC